jgi:hypothetical protein
MTVNNGHGVTQNWAHESIFYTKDGIPRLSSDQRFPAMVLMTSLNGYFVLPNRCLVEEMFRRMEPEPWPPSPPWGAIG